MNCPNIMQMVAKIKKPKMFNKLVFFFPIVDKILAILKIMIFVNNFNEEVILAIYLQNLLFAQMKSFKKRLIKTFTLILKPDTKIKYLKKFCNSDTRILICIDTAGMGIDIKNIVQIVQ